MKSATFPAFWIAYQALNSEIRQRARKAYKLWRQNPFHPSLHFKCINQQENIWLVIITLNYRAIVILEEDTIIGFWIENYEDYEQFFS